MTFPNMGSVVSRHGASQLLSRVKGEGVNRARVTHVFEQEMC